MTQAFFDALWQNYTAIAPRVSGIRDRIAARGDTVVNDHVAFRTYDRSPIDRRSLGRLIASLGYEAFEDYRFDAKKVDATAYVHPDGGPRVFLSELCVDELEPHHQAIIDGLVAQIPTDAASSLDVFTAGRLWQPIDFATYLDLRESNEYAAWVAAMGIRPNHFTVDVNALTSFDGLASLLDFVEEEGFDLNTAGGRIKGSPEVYLEQGSTMADKIESEFADGTQTIPSCYYEFAYRHAMPNGELYQGFVASSADKIFESTNS